MKKRKREPKKQLSKQELLDLLLNHEQQQIEKMDQMVDLLIAKNISININEEQEEEISLGDRMADKVASFAGSWVFILTFAGILVVWIIINAFLFSNPFDKYPFVLLNLILSTIAAIQAPIIMMSQNRQDKKDRLRSDNDYKIDLKAEFILESMYHKLNDVLEHQEELSRRVNKIEKLLKNEENEE